MAKIKNKINRLKRMYPYITRYKYGYKKPKDLEKKGSKIFVWVVLHDPERGAWTTFKVVLQTSKSRPRSVDEWREYLQGKGREVIVEKIIPTINVKRGRNWQFQQLIVWTIPYAAKGGKRAVAKSKDSSVARGDKKKSSRKTK